MESKLEEGCCVVACERPLDAQYWDAQWKSNTIGWDLGMPAPPLVSLIDSIENKSVKILIPGCGNAYEAEYLVSKGFKNITLIDISETACAILKVKFLNQSAVRVLCEDFFKLEDKFDVIIEQTFFCALPPIMRQRYVWKMHSLLNDHGILAGLLFNRQFDVSPPFGGSLEEYEKLFQTAFHIDQLSTANNSVTPRANTELFFSFVKNNSVMVNLYSFEGITCTGCKNSVTEIYSKIDGVIKVSMSSDFKEVLIVSDKEIDMKLLQELVSYEKDYKVISY
jgi:SAM-dependent methyltransferase